jgi:hypothetical protein
MSQAAFSVCVHPIQHDAGQFNLPFKGASKLISSGTAGKKASLEMFGKPPLVMGSTTFEGGISAVADCVKETAVCAPCLM